MESFSEKRLTVKEKLDAAGNMITEELNNTVSILKS